MVRFRFSFAFFCILYIKFCGVVITLRTKYAKWKRVEKAWKGSDECNKEEGH